jgi:PmbA protein
MSKRDNTFNLLDDLIKQALKAGCDAAEAVFVTGDGVSASVRHGQLEHIERPSGTALGLRAFCGKRQTSLSTSDLSGKALKKLVSEAVQIARVSPEDPYCGLIEEDELASGTHKDLEIFDSAQPPADGLKEMALRAEAVALEEKAITNSEGAGAGWSKKTKYHLTSKGFCGSYSSSNFSLSAVLIAGQGAGMERDYEYSTTRFLADLKTPEEIGRKAAKRTVKRLNPRKIKTGAVPVIFSRRVSASLLGHFSGAINGQAIARGTSFLKDAMEKKVFSRGIRIIDDPLRKRPGDCPGRGFAILAAGWVIGAGVEIENHRPCGTGTGFSPTSGANQFLYGERNTFCPGNAERDWAGIPGDRADRHGG